MSESSLSSAELTSMRNAVATVSLVGTAYIMRQTDTQDASGNVVPGAWATASTADVMLSKRIRRVEIDVRAEREAEENFYMALLPVGADVEPDDQLKIDGVMYSINILWTGHAFALGTRARITRID